MHRETNEVSKAGSCRSIVAQRGPIFFSAIKVYLGEGIPGSPPFSGVSAFTQMKEVLGRYPSASVGSHLPPAQSHPYAKVVCSGPMHKSEGG